MAANEHVTLGTTTNGRCARGPPGRTVELPVRDVAGGCGFVAGEAGSGAAETAGLLAGSLAERDHGLLIVDGYGDLPGGRNALRVGGSEACDLRLTEDRLEPVADLAFEVGSPVVLDRSTYRDPAAADAAVAAVVRRLCSVAEERAGHFLVIVVGIEAYLPADGPEGDAGRVLRTIARDGSRRGVGLCGVSRRPAAVWRAFLEGCDWRVWHRLSGTDATKVVRRRLDGEYASAVEGLADREVFLATDRSGSVRRVAVERVGASETAAVEPSPDADRLANLRDRLAEHGDRIADLETRLEAAGGAAQVAGTTDGLAPEPTPDPAVGEPDAGDRRLDDGPDDDGLAAFGAMMGDGPEDDGGDGLAALAGLGSASGNGAGGNGEGDEEPTGDALSFEPTGAPSIGAQVADFERGAAAGVIATREPPDPFDDRPAVVGQVAAALASLDDRALSVLEEYRAGGPDRPGDAYRRATGTSDRLAAYALNRKLRLAGLVEHVGRGYYDYCLPATIAASCGDGRKPAVHARNLEQEYLDG